MTLGIGARDAELAFLAVAADCPHDVAEPVVLSTGELVAAVCAACLQELPKEWGCSECEWAEVRLLCRAQPELRLARSCQRHLTVAN